MAVPEQTPYKEYTANGVTTSFPLEFDCDNQDHLIVTVNDIEPENGQWSLINGAVVFLLAPANQAKIIIQRNTPLERNTDYQTYNNSFRPQPVNKDLDRIWWKLQELGHRDQLIWLALVKEIADRIAGDKNLQNQINAIDNWLGNLQENVDQNTNDIEQLVNDLSKEIADRIKGDQILKDMFLSMIDEAINEGTINALAVTHVDSLEALEGVTNVWDGRTIYIKDLGNYRYDASTTTWVKAYQDADNVKDGSESQMQINDKSVRVFESIADLLTYTPRKDGQVVYVKGYHNPTNFALAKPYVGGGHRVYVASRKAENDGFSCINGWVLALENPIINTDMAGLKDGDSCVDAIRKCIKYLGDIGGGELIISDGNYVLDAQSLIKDPISDQSRWRYWFEMRNGVTVRGSRNAVLKVEGGIVQLDKDNLYAKGYQVFVDVPAHMRNEVTTGFKLQGFTIDGNLRKNPVGDMNQYNTQAQCNFVIAWRSDDLTIENMCLKNNGGWQPISINMPSKGAYIKNNRFENMGAVLGNSKLFDHSTIYITAFDYEISMNTFINDEEDTKSTAIEIHGVNGAVFGNYIKNYNQAFIRSAMIADSSNVHVYANTAVGVTGGFDLWAEDGWNLTANFTNNTIVHRQKAGNEVHFCGTSAGISDNHSGRVEFYLSGNKIFGNKLGNGNVYVGGKVSVFESTGNTYQDFSDLFIIGSATKNRKCRYTIKDTFKNSSASSLIHLYNWLNMQQENMEVDIDCTIIDSSKIVMLNTSGIPIVNISGLVKCVSNTKLFPYIGAWNNIKLSFDLECDFDRGEVLSSSLAPNTCGVIKQTGTSDYFEKKIGNDRWISRRNGNSKPSAPQQNGDYVGDIVYTPTNIGQIGYICTNSSPDINTVGTWKRFGAVID